MIREITTNDEARERLLSGIEKISSAVKSTLGPMGKTVIIESDNHTNGMTVTKDGVTVARSIALEDSIENLAVRMIKSASEKTSLEAGDGTTTSVVLSEAMSIMGLESISGGLLNTWDLTKHIKGYVSRVVEILKGMSREVTNQNLYDVARISANNDESIGSIIAETYTAVGHGGLVTIENSMTESTYYEVTHGVRVDRGYTSKLFVNDQKKDECVFENCLVFLSDIEIGGLLQIEEVLKHAVNSNRPLLIIAPMSQGAINTLAANVMRNKLRFCNINPPSFGYKTHELMKDLALVTGASYFSQQAGDDLALVRPEDLGLVKKVTVSSENTIIVTDGVPDEVNDVIEDLKVQLQNATKESDRKFINERLSYLKAVVGVIYVGGSSDIEQKEKYDRVDDAVCAVRSALEEGILPGGGVALMRAANQIMKETSGDDGLTREQNVAIAIVVKSCHEPIRRLLANADFSEERIDEVIYNISGSDSISSGFDKNYGYNLKTGKYGDMFDMGVIDPLKVTKNSLINATSVATTIMNTNAVITYAREKK